MIFRLPTPEEAIDQGDIIDECPLFYVSQFDSTRLFAPEVRCVPSRVVVLTQTCDLANGKTDQALCAVARDAETLIRDRLLKASEIRGPIRAGRVYGWYFLPKEPSLALPELVVDFHHLHSVRLDLLVALCRQGKRRARIQPLYREHLAKHFADTFSRIGLPEPYPTD